MAAPLLKTETKILKQVLQKLWKSKLSYRECSIVKQSIKDLLQSELPENAGEEVIAEVIHVVILNRIRPQMIRPRWALKVTGIFFFRDVQPVKCRHVRKLIMCNTGR